MVTTFEIDADGAGMRSADTLEIFETLQESWSEQLVISFAGHPLCCSSSIECGLAMVFGDCKTWWPLLGGRSIALLGAAFFEVTVAISGC